MYTETNKNKNKDKHGVPPTKRFSLLGSLVARLEALASSSIAYAHVPKREPSNCVLIFLILVTQF